MTKSSAGGTVTPTTTGESPRSKNYDIDENDVGFRSVTVSRPESKPVLRKRRRAEPSSSRTGIPRKTPRRTGEKEPGGDPPNEAAPEDVPAEIRVDVKNETANPIRSLARCSRSRVSSDGRCDDVRSACDRKQLCGDTIVSADRPKRAKQDINEKHQSADSTKQFAEDAQRKNKSVVGLNDRAVKEPSNRKSDQIVTADSRQEPNDDTEDKSADSSTDFNKNIEIHVREASNRNESDETKITKGATKEHDDDSEHLSVKLPPMHPDSPRIRLMGLSSINRRDDSARLRKTIQWLEEGSRKLREDLAETRSELYEERRAARLARREVEVAVREARSAESAKHQRIIAELKARSVSRHRCCYTRKATWRT